jgi:hypothetical protein
MFHFNSKDLCVVEDAGFRVVISDGKNKSRNCLLHEDLNAVVRPMGRKRTGCRGVYTNTLIRVKKFRKTYIKNDMYMLILRVEILSHSSKYDDGVIGKPEFL